MNNFLSNSYCAMLTENVTDKHQFSLKKYTCYWSQTWCLHSWFFVSSIILLVNGVFAGECITRPIGGVNGVVFAGSLILRVKKGVKFTASTEWGLKNFLIILQLENSVSEN